MGGKTAITSIAIVIMVGIVLWWHSSAAPPVPVSTGKDLTPSSPSTMAPHIPHAAPVRDRAETLPVRTETKHEDHAAVDNKWGVDSWGRELRSHPGADIGLLWARYHIRMLTSAEGRRWAASTTMSNVGLRKIDSLISDRTLNPEGKKLGAEDRKKLAALGWGYNRMSVDHGLDLQLWRARATEAAILAGDFFVIPGDPKGRKQAQEAFQRQFGEVNSNFTFAEQPGAVFHQMRRIVLRRSTHPEIFRNLDEDRVLSQDLRAAYKQFFEHLK